LKLPGSDFSRFARKSLMICSRWSRSFSFSRSG